MKTFLYSGAGTRMDGSVSVLPGDGVGVKPNSSGEQEYMDITASRSAVRSGQLCFILKTIAYKDRYFSDNSYLCPRYVCQSPACQHNLQ